MVRHIDEAGRAAIKHFESCRLEAYRDAGGVWTIGWGSTRGVTPGMTITQAEADQRFEADLAPAETAVASLVRVPLTDGQFAALVSFVFNCGAGTLRTSSLLRLLNGGDYAAVPAELRRFRFAHGKPLKGLAVRRAAEAALWAGLDPLPGARPKAAAPHGTPQTPGSRPPSSAPASPPTTDRTSSMGALTTISSIFSLVETFGPLIPEVVAEVPDIAKKAAKLATDVKAMDVTDSISDLEALVAAAAVPFGVITKTVEASKSLTA
jgi:GH24 family phage-related lysozyme (muramidase)